MNAKMDDMDDVSLEDARSLLIDLVSIPSPTGEETEAAKRLVEFFAAHGREAWIDEIGNVRAPADDAVLLTSHVDTVPGEIPVDVQPADTEDVEAEVADEEGEDVLWGRGSVDATGPLAAMAAAAVRTGVSFVGVVGEEIDSKGARYLVDDRDEPPEAVVNGEPSSTDGITLGYRGLLAGTYVATSESGHTSWPDPNAIQRAIRWWATVEEQFESEEDGVGPPDRRNGGGEAAEVPVFEQVTTKPVDVDGGVSDDGLSVEATMDVQFRVPPELEVETVREAAEAELEVGTVTWNDEVPPVMTSPRTAVARAFRVAIRDAGEEPRLVRKTGTSDMNIYADAWDCPMATYGPGNSDLDHAPDERLSLAAFDQSVEILERVATTLSDGDDR
ncbi:[LysW]-lysine hydrolase [Natronobacterium gregoryi]|uniref:Putative [LysW]-lysine/[LysW]-ornithine hydrolase n=2 Tax=Natronobacterium gregoryi TaxID=44930 RepID=L0AG77_NATGS|nr:[LysW]-lysine hydrolase [Natronobacterium gregoryi]AFZ72821.1 N-acetyl-ornithine/N-acetyl-lysine deacetylase [Natronobacterium gregoryi SP2]ELY69415.1 acetyl-lysine deacetylase [Natronobacterium gregoryi SP2]PLK21161.1 acetyl-lysine deacetylase [Natronobacterium gregoryi SP2]SFJ09962.1 acetylornithine deacetylase [Natronobacterium gregoryi]